MMDRAIKRGSPRRQIREASGAECLAAQWDEVSSAASFATPELLDRI